MPVVYYGGKMTDVATLLPAGTPWTLTTIGGINNCGQIAGTGVVHDAVMGDRVRGYLLTPVVAP